MLAHPTLDKLNAMGLAGMAKAFGELVTNGEAEHLSHAEWLGLLLELGDYVFECDELNFPI